MARGAGFIKWVVAPALAAFLGFRVIGPHYAGDSKLSRLVEKGKAAAQSRLVPATSEPKPESTDPTSNSDSKPDESPTVSSDVPSPKVTVGVKPVEADAPTDDAPKPRRRRRRRHRSAAPSDEAPPEATATPDRTGPDPASTP